MPFLNLLNFEINSGRLKGNHIPVACLCWFTSTGKLMPKLIKIKLSDGSIYTLDKIHINFSEEKHYNGIPSMEFQCQIIDQEQAFTLKLIYFTIEYRWVIFNYTFYVCRNANILIILTKMFFWIGCPMEYIAWTTA